MDTENSLRVQLAATADGIALAEDLVPAAIQAGERRVRRDRLAIAASAGALATTAFAVVAVGHRGNGGAAPAATTTTAAATTGALGHDNSPGAFSEQIQAVLAKLFPGATVTVRLLPNPAPSVDPGYGTTVVARDPDGHVLTRAEVEEMAAHQHHARYTLSLTTSSGEISGNLLFAFEGNAGDKKAAAGELSCTQYEAYHTPSYTLEDCMQGARTDGTEAWAFDTQGTRLTVDPATGMPTDASSSVPARWYDSGFMYHGVLWGLSLDGGADTPPAGTSLAQLMKAVLDPKFATLIDAWKTSQHITAN